MSHETLRVDREPVGPGARRQERPLQLLFHYSVLNRGGAENSILRLMHRLVELGHEVHLVLTAPGGALEPEVDARVHITHLRSVRAWEPVRGNRLVGTIRKAIQWMVGNLEEVVSRRRYSRASYDGAFIGLAGLSSAFVCNHLDATKRFVFVRNDPAQADLRGRWARDIRRFHHRIDGYLCVCRSVEQAMERRFPSIADKVVTIYNLLDPADMQAKASGENPFPGGSTLPRVLTVCRLLEAPKALLRMVEVHRRLLDKGVSHSWHVLGDGPDRDLLEEAIRRLGVQSSFILHGAKANPFPWYRHADVVAVLSNYEGLCGVVNEARVLARPVIATRFSGIEEQIQSGVNGLIVEQTVDSICSGMASLLNDAALRSNLGSGGYPAELLDDEAKVARLLNLVRGPRSAGMDSA